MAPSVSHDDWELLRKIAPVPGLWLGFAWGLHPYFVLELTSEVANQRVEELRFRLDCYPKEMVAIGECGLDFLRGPTPAQRELQVEVFRAQLELARATGLPLSIHCVKAHGVLLELLRERATPPSMLHAFSGSAEVARELVAAGHYISFAANVCIPGARKVVDAARSVPDERLLIETDSPDQTPPNRRPGPNEPAFVRDVAERLAELRGVELSSLARSTFLNACRVLSLKPDQLLGDDPSRLRE